MRTGSSLACAREIPGQRNDVIDFRRVRACGAAKLLRRVGSADPAAPSVALKHLRHLIEVQARQPSPSGSGWVVQALPLFSLTRLASHHGAAAAPKQWAELMATSCAFHDPRLFLVSLLGALGCGRVARTDPASAAARSRSRQLRPEWCQAPLTVQAVSRLLGLSRPGLWLGYTGVADRPQAPILQRRLLVQADRAG